MVFDKRHALVQAFKHAVEDIPNAVGVSHLTDELQQKADKSIAEVIKVAQKLRTQTIQDALRWREKQLAEKREQYERLKKELGL